MSYDLLKQQKKSFSIKVSGSEISSLKHNSILKSGCRVYRDGKIYSSAHVGETSNDELISLASDKNNVGVKYDFKLSEPSQFTFASEEKAPTEQNLVDEFNNILDRAKSDFPDLVWSGECELTNESISFLSSEGHNLNSSGLCKEWYLLYKKKGSKDMMDGFIDHRGLENSFSKTYDRYFDFIKMLNKIEKPSSNKVPVMFVQMNESIRGKISEDISANKFETGSSLLSGKLGNQIFSKEVSLFDVNFQPEYAIYNRFDGEGVQRENLPVFENGVFVNALYDLRTAHKYNKKTTGNGFRRYNTGVSVQHFNLVLNRGKKSWKELARQFDECIVVFVAAGGACDDNWDFSTPVQVSYLLKKGEVIGQCPQLTMKANLKEMLGGRYLGTSQDSFIGDELHPCLFAEMDILLH